MRKSYRIPIAIFGWIAVSLTCLALIHRVSGEETDSASDRTAFDQLKQKPLKFPTVTVNERCPVSRGSRDIVPHDGYIFCSGCFWYGKRPVLVAMSWSDQSSDEARFPLDNRMPRDGHFYLVKTPWVSQPDYSGPMLIRGLRLNEGATDKLRFSVYGKTADVLELDAPARDRTDLSHWSFWPTYMFVPGPGCYGVQLDTSNATDVVIFEALAPR